MERVTADQAIDLLIASGVPVEVRDASRIDFLHDGRIAVEVKVMQNPATPSQILRDRKAAGEKTLLYVVPHITKSLHDAASSDGIAVVGVNDGMVMVGGEELRPLSAEATNPVLPHSRRRTPWGRFAVMRALCRCNEPRTQYQLAEEAGITQAAVSHSLGKLAHNVTKLPTGWRTVSVRSMATQFLSEYPGAGGVSASWFSLEPVITQGQQVLDLGADKEAILSGDAGADQIAPWRQPRKAIVYASAGVELAEHGFVQTTKERATLELRVPRDPTLWATANAFADGRRSLTADPLIVSHDLARIGGSDAKDAIEHLLDVLVRNWDAK